MIINSKVYDWADVSISFPDFYLSIQEISYSDELEKELVYSTGNKPVGYGTGNYKAELKFTLLKDHYTDFLDYCKKKNTAPLKITVPKVVVSYGNDGQRTVTDVINNITFTKFSDKAAQGDKQLKVECECLVFGTISRDGVASI